MSDENFQSNVTDTCYDDATNDTNSDAAMNGPCIDITRPKVVDTVAVYWPLEEQFFKSVVASQDENKISTIKYDDGDVEELEDDQRKNCYRTY